MKSTGIIRRIDDLGWVVIPKELRRRLNIHVGDPLELELCLNEGGVLFRKYVPYTDVKDTLETLREVINEGDDLPNRDKALKMLDEIERVLKGEDENG